MFWSIAIAVLLFVVMVVVWGVLHLRHSYRVASEAVLKVGPDEVQGLCAECSAVFRERFDEHLELGDLEGSARILSARLDDSESLKQAFAKPDFYWYFVLPVGAYLGELVRQHAHGSWAASEGGGIELKVPVAGDFATTYPFDKVLKHVTSGGKGDIYAYLMSAVRLEEALGDLVAEA